MFKLLVILGLVFYVLYKVGSFFFRAGVSSGQQRQAPEVKKPKGNTTIKGGDYVDYEEVK
jgi:hypothetical protein